MSIENYFFLEQITSILEDDYFTIMSIIAGLYIGLLAFMYPRIIDFKTSIQNKFVALYKMFSRGFCGFLQWMYLPIISGLLIFTLGCILFSIKNDEFYFIYINLFFAIGTIVLNWTMAKRMEKYLFRTDELHNKLISKIDFSKNLSIEKNMDEYSNKLQELQSAILYFLNKDVLQHDQIKKYINYIMTSFWQYIDYSKQIHNGKWSSNDPNNQYYECPLKVLTYISQIAMDKNKQNISIYIVDKFCEILEKFDYGEKSNSLIYSSILSYVNTLFIYPIRTHKLDSIVLLEYSSVVFANLIKVSSLGTIFSNLRPHKFLFGICKEIIDVGLPIYNLLLIRNRLDFLIDLRGAEHTFNNDDKLWNLSRYYVTNSTFDILAYLYYQGKYKDLREYIGNQMNNIFCMLPKNMQDIIKYVFTKENSIFNPYFKQKFNDYTTDNEYKYCILFLILCLIKQKINIHGKNIKYIETSNLDEHRKNINIDFEKKSINSLLNVDIPQNIELINVLDNQDLTSMLDMFFANKDLLTLFKFPNDMVQYREFILNRFEKIDEFIKRNK
jgi:hypothetical protein